MERIGQLVEVKNPGTGRVFTRFQNYEANRTIRYNQETWNYLPFLYQGATRNKSGDNMESGLVFAVSHLLSSQIVEYVEDRRTAIVRTVLFGWKEDAAGQQQLIVKRTLQKDVWLMASMTYDDTQLEVLLSSAIDAVGTNVPNRILTSDLVGSLPVSGSVQTG